ncbi:hypothetical protein C8Q74DRAFT_1366889 [Fomes fomentarius]|nr:hypothetical protein C8Q74DRAFT_1366889 [Fomes fomentarius]
MDSSIPSPDQVPALDNTYGAVLMGSNISLILYGFNIHQAYRYMRQFPNDSRFVKSIVWLTLALESMNSAFCIYISYHHLVTNYFNPIELTFASWALDSMPMATGLSMIVAQCFFVRRVYKLGGYLRIVAFVGVFMLFVEFGFCLAATIEAFIQPSFQAYESVTWLIACVFGSIILTDGMLTGSLILALRRSRTGLKSTDSLIDLIILYAVTTGKAFISVREIGSSSLILHLLQGLLTMIANLLSFFFALILPDNLIYVGINIFAGKLYVTSLLAALNSRTSLAQHAASATIYGSGGAVTRGGKSTATGPEIIWRVAQPTTTTDESVLDYLSGPSSKVPRLEHSVGQVDAYELRPVTSVA